MHTGAHLYKIPSLENKATCKVMNVIKLAYRHLNAIHLQVTVLKQCLSKRESSEVKLIPSYEIQGILLLHICYNTMVTKLLSVAIKIIGIIILLL